MVDVVSSKVRSRMMAGIGGKDTRPELDCRYASTPSTRAEFWMDKFAKNVERDGRNIAALEALGWRVRIVWECDIKADIDATILNVERWIRDEHSA